MRFPWWAAPLLLPACCARKRARCMYGVTITMKFNSLPVVRRGPKTAPSEKDCPVDEIDVGPFDGRMLGLIKVFNSRLACSNLCVAVNVAVVELVNPVARHSVIFANESVWTIRGILFTPSPDDNIRKCLLREHK